MDPQFAASGPRPELADAFAQLHSATESLRDEVRALADSYRQVERTAAANQVTLQAVARTLDTLVMRLEAKGVI